MILIFTVYYALTLGQIDLYVTGKLCPHGQQSVGLFSPFFFVFCSVTCSCILYMMCGGAVVVSLCE